MSSEWQDVSVEELADSHPHALSTGPFGSAISAKYFVDYGVPVIRGSNLSTDVAVRLVDEGLVYLSAAKASEFQRSVARRGDLVFTCWGTINQVGLIDERARYDWYIISNKQMKLTVDRTKVDSMFLYYLFSGPEKQAEILDNGIGSSVPGFNLGQLKRHRILLPSLQEQKRIVGLLGTLDDRITLLRETNATLEGIAQALFKSWFVDFDPVRAKQQGLEPEGMDEATAALFPDGFVEGELGVMPKGWTVNKVENLCALITNGGTPSRSKSELWEGGMIPWYKTGEFMDGFLLEPSERITEAALKQSSVKLLPENAILMAIYAAPTVGRLGVLTEPGTFNQACTGMVAKDTVGQWFLFWVLRFGRDWFNSRANGAAQQNISKAIVASYPVVTPPDSLLSAFHHLVDPIHQRIRTCSELARSLAGVRDTLLPRLISGQLRLPNDTLVEPDAILEEIA